MYVNIKQLLEPGCKLSSPLGDFQFHHPKSVVVSKIYDTNKYILKIWNI